MKKSLIIITVLFLLLALIAVPAVLVLFGLDREPSVLPGKSISVNDLKRINRLIKENDPRKLRSGEVRKVYLSERDINLFLDYAISITSLKNRLSADVALSPGLANADFTYVLPDNPFGPYLNISANFSQSADSITIYEFKVGALTAPGWILSPVTHFLLNRLERYESFKDVDEILQSLEKVHLKDRRLLMAYRWRPGVMERLRAGGRDFILPEDKKRLEAYNHRLAEVAAGLKGKRASLVLLLRPIFELAHERTINGGEGIAENRAAILTLGLYAAGVKVRKLLSESGRYRFKRTRYVRMTLFKRNDLARHFLISSAIAVSAGSGIADIIGLSKEVGDSQGGSGFSFADLAADRAGVYLGKVATASPGSASSIQSGMKEVGTETDFMPRTDHLPEGIMELEFRRKYNDLDSEAYKMVEKEIERRIGMCRVYQMINDK